MGDRLVTIDHTTTVLRPFFRDHPGEPVREENFCTLWCKGRLTEADTPTIRLGATSSGLTSAHLHPPIFYRPDALPATQPTVSKHLLTYLLTKEKLATIDTDRKLGGCAPLGRGDGSPSNTMWPGTRPTCC